MNLKSYWQVDTALPCVRRIPILKNLGSTRWTSLIVKEILAKLYPYIFKDEK